MSKFVIAVSVDEGANALLTQIANQEGEGNKSFAFSPHRSGGGRAPGASGAAGTTNGRAG